MKNQTFVHGGLPVYMIIGAKNTAKIVVPNPKWTRNLIQVGGYHTILDI